MSLSSAAEEMLSLHAGPGSTLRCSTIQAPSRSNGPSEYRQLAAEHVDQERLCLGQVGHCEPEVIHARQSGQTCCHLPPF